MRGEEQEGGEKDGEGEEKGGEEGGEEGGEKDGEEGGERSAERRVERRAERRSTGHSTSVPGARKRARATRRRRSLCGPSESRDTASTPSGSTRIHGFAPSPTGQARSGGHCLKL